MRRWLRGAFQLVLSQPILEETARTVQKPYFRRRLRQGQIDAFLESVRQLATVTPLTVTVQGVASHSEDDLVLATAVSANAPYLVTGDEALQQVRNYQKVHIVSPQAFLVILNGQP